MYYAHRGAYFLPQTVSPLYARLVPLAPDAGTTRARRAVAQFGNADKSWKLRDPNLKFVDGGKENQQKLEHPGSMMA